MDDKFSQIRKNFEQVSENILNASTKCGRKADDVKLVVVTKAQPPEVVEAVINAGAKIVGENYPEETVPKKNAILDSSKVLWHMIGHLQGRKAKLVVAHFDTLESLDSLSLAIKLDRLCAESNRILPILLEFNVGGEESKSGWNASEKSQWHILIEPVQEIVALKNIKVCGLMTMPPLSADERKSRAYFNQLKELQGYLKTNFPEEDFSELSMGTSSDYKIAIEEGATLIRVGQAIVGTRPPKN